MHQPDVRAADPAECIQVTFAYLIWDHGSGGDDFYPGGWAASFQYNTAKNAEFKKVQIIAMYLSSLQIGPFIFSSSYRY
jgi:hypothetical protein